MRSRYSCHRSLVIFSILSLALVTASSAQVIQSKQTTTVQNANLVIKQIMATPGKRIPAALLGNAKGIVIVPSLIKGGFVVGVKHGQGVLVLKDEKGQWRAPYFVKLTGGSVGFQAGLQATDVILVFKTQRSVQGLLQGKFTVGVDAAAAAGPVGRQAAAATDGKLQAEIYSYSRSRGLFAGVSVDGSVLDIDHPKTSAYYLTPPGGEANTVPAEAIQLVQTIASYAGKTVTQAAKAAPTASVPVASRPSLSPTELPGGGTSPDSLRKQLAQSNRTLQTLLDPNWKAYLAVPAEVHNAGQHPSPQAIQSIVSRYDLIAKDPKYQVLAKRTEFQQTRKLLQQYEASLKPSSPTIALPPPPQK